MIRYEFAEDIQERVNMLIESADFNHIVKTG